MTHRELFELYSLLVELERRTAKPAFSLAVVQNLDRLRFVAERLDKEYQISPEYRAYEEARRKVCETHAKKDVKGRPIVVSDQFVIDRHDQFQKAIKALRKEHRKAIGDYEQLCRRLEQYLSSASETVEIVRVRLTECPELTPEQMRSLLPMIEPEAVPAT